MPAVFVQTISIQFVYRKIPLCLRIY